MAIKRCTRQPAQTAEKNATFHSNQTEAGQYTAENATQNEDHHADIKLLSLYHLYSINKSFFFLILALLMEITL